MSSGSVLLEWGSQCEPATNEIHNVYSQPKSLQQHWAHHISHSPEEHNSCAVLNRYLDYRDANLATL